MKTSFLWPLIVATLILPGRVGGQTNTAEAHLSSARILKGFGDQYVKDGSASKATEMYTKAADSFNKAIALQPSGSDAYFGLGDVYMNCLRKYELALPVWMKLSELRPADPHVFLLRGLTYKALKRYDEGIGDFQTVLSMQADTESLGYANQDIGLIYYEEKKYALAIAPFRKAIQLDPTNDKACNELGMAHYGLEQYADAVAAYKKAISLKPDHAAYQANVGLAYAAMGRKDEALDVYRDVVMRDKAQGKWLRGRMEEFSIRVADTSARLGELEQATLKGYVKDGDGHVMANELPQAIDLYQKALKLDPECGRAHDGLAVCYYRQRKWELAIAEWDRALPWITPAANTYVLLGDSHFALKQYDKALEAYREAAGLKPGTKDLARVEYSMGRVYREMKKYELGIEHLRESLRLNPDFGDANFVIGECYFFLYRYAESAAAMEKVVKIRPKDTQPRVLLGYAYANLRRFGDARAQYERLKPLDADKAEMLLKEIDLRSN